MSWEVIWVDLATGEIVPEGSENAEPIDFEVADEPPSAAEQPDSEWLADWWLRKDAELVAAVEAAKRQAERIARLHAAKRRHLDSYLPRLREVARASLTGRRKSVDFAFGRAIFRESTKSRVFDEAAAMAWASEHAPAAIKLVAPSLLVSKLPKDEEVPGVAWDSSETFAAGAGKLVRPLLAEPEPGPDPA